MPQIVHPSTLVFVAFFINSSALAATIAVLSQVAFKIDFILAFTDIHHLPAQLDLALLLLCDKVWQETLMGIERHLLGILLQGFELLEYLMNVGTLLETDYRFQRRD